MAQPKTPDVYIKEKSLLPPSVAEVPTAIPAFIGYTEKAMDGDMELATIPSRITSMLEFEQYFGLAHKEAVKVDTNLVFSYDWDTVVLPKFFLHQAVSHFFANGGGACYTISIGKHADTALKSKTSFTAAITSLKKVDEVTLISCPESVLLTSQDHYDVQNAALTHCENMMDRFALIDVQQIEQGGAGRLTDPNDPTSATVDEVTKGTPDLAKDRDMMRNKVTQGLKYGAAYYPYLESSIPRSFDEHQVTVTGPFTYRKLDVLSGGTKNADYSTLDGEKTLNRFGHVLDSSGNRSTLDNKHYPVYIKLAEASHMSSASQVDEMDVIVDLQGYAVDAEGHRIPNRLAYGIFTNTAGKALNIDGRETNEKSNILTTDENTYALEMETISELPLAELEEKDNALYNSIKQKLSQQYLTLPPSAAIAGIIAKTDAQRGVWKAPANVALAQVIKPSLTIDNGEQEDLNVDVTAGKSINAIRSFLGKGNLVWGARTLAGNDNEWRYVPVRRLFNMVEENVKKASYFAVFEPNTSLTWSKIKTMISGYLEGIWEQGGLFGDTPDQAFFVNVGLGQTMTENDINNGNMNIEIGIAAVRPAEFIILTFSHKSISG